MIDLQVYEYYDGYEWDRNEHMKVRYIVLGKTDSGHVAICYTDEHSFVAKIGQTTHSRAWKKRTIGLKEALAYIEKYSSEETVSSVDDEIKETIKNKDALDKEHACLPGHSLSASVGLYEHFYCKYGESYSEKKIEALTAKRNLLYIRDECILSLKCALATTVDINTPPETHPKV